MSVISRKNQVTLPAAALRRAGLGPGDEIVIEAVAPGRLALTRAIDPVSATAGIFGSDERYPEGYLEDLRRDWDRPWDP